MDISLHSTVRLLQRPDTSVLMVSAASPACLCIRLNPQPHILEYVGSEFKRGAEMPGMEHGGGGGAQDPILGGKGGYYNATDGHYE